MTNLRVIASRLEKLGDLPLSSDFMRVIEEASRCPRCGTEMESIGGGVGCLGISVDFVVPPILVLKCPQCGYEERSWACPGY